MIDYIEREAAIALWENDTKRGRTEFDQVLMLMPSADVRAVVLCKNCTCYDSRNFLCEHFNVEVGREDYCSYGY